MTTRVTAILIAIICLLGGIYFAFRVRESINQEPPVSKSVLCHTWSKVTLGEARLSIRVPLSLSDMMGKKHAEPRDKIQDRTCLGAEGQGLKIRFLYLKYRCDIEPSLTKIAENTVGGIRIQPDTTNIHSSNIKRTVMGLEALETEATYERKGGVPLMMRHMLISRGIEVWGVLLIYRKDQENGNKVWVKMVDSIHMQKDA